MYAEDISNETVEGIKQMSKTFWEFWKRTVSKKMKESSKQVADRTPKQCWRIFQCSFHKIPQKKSKITKKNSRKKILRNFKENLDKTYWLISQTNR